MTLRILAAVALIFATIWPAPSSSAPPADWPAGLTIGTGSPGGTFPIFGEALAAILTKALDMPVSTQGRRVRVKIYC